MLTYFRLLTKEPNLRTWKHSHTKKNTQHLISSFVHSLKVVRLGLVFFMGNPTRTKINTNKYDSKSLLNQGVKIGENGSKVTVTMKAANFHQILPPFIHLDTKNQNFTTLNM